MQRRMVRTVAIIATALLALATLSAGTPARAQESTRCFPETGQCVAGRILDYWTHNGGLAVFGYPISEQRTETVEGSWSGPIQWFERDRLEDHANQGLGVLAGRLGARALELQARPWQGLPLPAERLIGCRSFPETGHTICGAFLRFWERNGGLERFGYPISEPGVETIETWTGSVQYFERRRMEHHTELAGTPYEVLLGLLGRVALAAQNIPACASAPGAVAFGLEPRISDVRFRSALICPAQSYVGVPAAFQPFQGGHMIWIDLGANGRSIIVTRRAGRPAPDPTYFITPDTYQEGEVLIPAGDAPPGMYVPVGGFGKIWRGRTGQGQWIGYGTAPERAESANVQFFGGGGFIIHLRETDQVWVFGPHATYWEHR
ncbi:hypothetical protein EKD04_007720 [Chloroflexales bacterium ZM16-3]|nr:hypothetical protein [Chloroflexales bacterium ZM16-3]